MQIPKLSLFFNSIDSFWLLFFLKTHFTGETNIYLCIYWVLLGGFDAINASNQRTICSYMIFQPSWFILYVIFSINSIVFYEIFYNDVTPSRDVTYLFTDPNKICTPYVKLNSKHILFMRIFRFIFRDNYDYSFHIYIYIYIYDRGFTDREEICTAHVESNSKHILFMRMFWFTIYFSR